LLDMRKRSRALRLGSQVAQLTWVRGNQEKANERSVKIEVSD
jgi:hypothetical protein